LAFAVKRPLCGPAVETEAETEPTGGEGCSYIIIHIHIDRRSPHTGTNTDSEQTTAHARTGQGARLKPLKMLEPRVKDRQTDRQTDSQTVRQADRQTGRQTDRQTVRQTDGRTDGQTNKFY